MTVYTSTARFDTGRAMTEEELYKAAPSIFATEAHHSRSERFAPIPTIEIVRGMAREGFSVVGATQAVARIDDKKNFTKHLLRFRRMDEAAKYTVGGSVMEILLRNGNDGSSAYNLMAGMFRIACMNSLVCQTSTIDEISVRHSGKAFDKVIEGSYEVLKSAEQVMRAPAEWSQIQLSDRARHAFAVGAHVERFGDEPTTSVKPDQLLIARRAADTGKDLWSTFNVIQENAVRGGLTGFNPETRRRGTTRQIKGIDQSVKVNKGLWVMADYLSRHAA